MLVDSHPFVTVTNSVDNRTYARRYPATTACTFPTREWLQYTEGTMDRSVSECGLTKNKQVQTWASANSTHMATGNDYFWSCDFLCPKP